MDTTEEESGLFRSITAGNLSEDQWQMFKKLQKLNRNYVATADDENEDKDDGSDFDDVDEMLEGDVEEEEEDEEVEAEAASAADVAEALAMPGTSSSSAVASTSDPKTAKKQLQASVLTRRYIRGEITFTEFTELVERSNEEQDNNSELEDSMEQSNEMDDDDGDEDFELKQKTKARRTPKKSAKKSAEISSPVKSPTLQDKEFQEELQKAKKRNRCRHNRLPRDLQGLVGEANLRFAQGDHEVAIKMCMDVIVLAPLCPEPFQTLGMIYEELGDKEKLLQFSLISAHLSPNDAEEWVRLAEMSIECDDLKQAITCYGRAIRCEPENLDLMWSRCKLYEQLGETRRLVEQLEQILGMLKEGDGDTYLRVARGLTRVLHDDNQLEKATLAMEDAFRKHPASISSEDINILVELQMKRNILETSIKILCEHCAITFQPENVLADMDDTEIMVLLGHSESCTVPESVPVDLTVKLIICLIRLDVNRLCTGILELLLKENPEEVGDLYLDVAEAYMDMSLHADAAPLLETLVKTERYELAAVWLRYGECLNVLGRLEEAVDAYRRVVALAPAHLVARMTLSGLLQQIGKTEDALTVLEQDEDNAEAQLEPQLLLHRCNLLYSRGLFDEFLRVSKLLHSSHIKWPTSKIQISDRIAAVSSHRLRSMKNKRDEVSRFSNNGLDPSELWANYHKMCQKLLDLKRFDELQVAGVMSITSTCFTRDSNILQECDVLRLLACYFSGSHEDAYRLMRFTIFKNMNSNRVWVLFNLIVSTMKDLRHNRFCLRLLYKHPNHLALGMLNGHNALVSGSYKHSLGEYMAVLKMTPDDPLINLCVGLIFIHMTCQKFTGKKQALIVQACVFLNRYLELRGETQESYYNLGRAMHQINFLHSAEHYYLKALECEVPIDERRFDLRSEIAFNLALIYRVSKANHLSHIYMDKYCII